MNNYNNNILYKDLSYIIIGTAFKVHSKLGCALPEYCYSRALVYEFIKLDIPFTHQKRHDVYYDNEYVGHFFTDIIVDDKIILELKSDLNISPNHYAQLFTYLRTTNIKVGYIINFGSRHLQFKRLIL